MAKISSHASSTHTLKLSSSSTKKRLKAREPGRVSPVMRANAKAILSASGSTKRGNLAPDVYKYRDLKSPHNPPRSKDGGNPRPWGGGNFGNDALKRPGQHRSSPTPHAKAAALTAVAFSSKVKSGFLIRQDEDNKRRERELRKKQEDQEAKLKKEKENATKMSKKSKKLLEEVSDDNQNHYHSSQPSPSRTACLQPPPPSFNRLALRTTRGKNG